MAPLFYFLASSLNVELVYIVLKSVTQFCNVICEKNASNINFVGTVDSHDLTIQLDKISNLAHASIVEL